MRKEPSSVRNAELNLVLRKNSVFHVVQNLQQEPGSVANAEQDKNRVEVRLWQHINNHVYIAVAS